MPHLSLLVPRHQKTFSSFILVPIFQPFNHLCCMFLQSHQTLHIPLNHGDRCWTQSSNSDYNVTNSEYRETVAPHASISPYVLVPRGPVHHITWLLFMPGSCCLCLGIILDPPLVRWVVQRLNIKLVCPKIVCLHVEDNSIWTKVKDVFKKEKRQALLKQKQMLNMSKGKACKR